ncbi:hypothetical protein V9L05_01365 [Bernardetia sp. Wsw4-3y2]|uniref:hypothetical protein n=1 Tax=Bernardetia sp. Wsw4-3y2 TaxID=3127471 RepID=UPI0030CCC3F7
MKQCEKSESDFHNDILKKEIEALQDIQDEEPQRLNTIVAKARPKKLEELETEWKDKYKIANYKFTNLDFMDEEQRRVACHDILDEFDIINEYQQITDTWETEGIVKPKKSEIEAKKTKADIENLPDDLAELYRMLNNNRSNRSKHKGRKKYDYYNELVIAIEKKINAIQSEGNK